MELFNYKQGAMCGVGAVLRDHSGAFRAATCHLYDGIADPEVAEIYACKRALQVAAELNTTKVILETDCATLANMLSTKEKILSAAGPWWRRSRRG